MNRRIFCTYSLITLLVLSQIGSGSSMTMKAYASSNGSVVFIQNQAGGVYRAEKKYEEWKKEYPNCIHEAKEWNKVNGRYQYPVTPYDKEWGTYVLKAERYTACQIPQEILNTLTTGELLELVLDSPVIINLYIQDSIVEGVKILAKEFNGMNELLSREDCLAVVSQYYSEYDIPAKQQLDYDALLGDSANPDYDVIVDNKTLMKKADKDAKVMDTLNLCEAIMEIACRTKKLSTQEEQSLSKIILQKSKEKIKSECIEGVSTEIDQEDSILNKYITKFPIKPSDNKKKNSRKKAGNESFKLPDGNVVEYYYTGKSGAISDTEIARVENYYSQYHFVSGASGKVVKKAGDGGTKKYNCYNYAWLKKFDPKNLWKKCVIDDDKGFCNYKYFTHSSKPGGAGWVGSGKGHAVYTIKEEVSYRDSNGQVYYSPLVYSKWGPNGALLRHPLLLSEYDINRTDDLVWYC